MSDLAELFEDPVVAGWVARALTRDLVRSNRNGLSLPSHAQEVISALDEAAGDLGLAGRFASEPVNATLGAVSVHGFIPVRDAAAACGVTTHHVRRLARDRKIRAIRPGRDWGIDLDSLKSVLRRAS